MNRTPARLAFLAAAALVVGAIAPAALSLGGAAPPQDEAPAMVVGSFDSRAVMVAYMRSERFKEDLAGVKQEMASAVEAGDQAAQDAINERMRARQEKAHRQVFSNAPAPEVVALLAEQLPGFAEQAGVDVIVSKWRLAYVGPGARFVDLTDRMVAAFGPDAETLEVVEQIKATDPVPLEQLEGGHEH